VPTVIKAEVVTDESAGQRPRGISEPLFAVLTLLALGMTLLVIDGLGLDRKGLAIAFAVVLAPPLAAIGVQTLIRHGRGKPFSWTYAFVIFTSYIMTVGVAMLLMVVLIVAASAATLAACFDICKQIAPPPKAAKPSENASSAIGPLERTPRGAGPREFAPHGMSEDQS
jgi:drug/metabolite transporter (DMT)-like permease